MLSPALFHLLIAPLLWQLQASGLGLTVNIFFAGGFLHADDIRTLATSEESLERQVSLVKVFADENMLRLNVSKCEIEVLFKSQSIASPTCVVEESVIPTGDVAKCLGFRWKGDHWLLSQ